MQMFEEEKNTVDHRIHFGLERHEFPTGKNYERHFLSTWEWKEMKSTCMATFFPGTYMRLIQKGRKPESSKGGGGNSEMQGGKQISGNMRENAERLYFQDGEKISGQCWGKIAKIWGNDAENADRITPPPRPSWRSWKACKRQGAMAGFLQRAQPTRFALPGPTGVLRWLYTLHGVGMVGCYFGVEGAWERTLGSQMRFWTDVDGILSRKKILGEPQFSILQKKTELDP